MRVFISADIEGVACVTHRDHLRSGGHGHELARKWMTAEVNAAIEGAYEAGADYVLVADSHGDMCNILPDDLHPNAHLVRGRPRPLIMLAGLDDTFDAVFLLGYHAMAGAARGILAHSFNGRSVLGIRLNDMPVGEAGFNAALAGHFGVPVAFVSGDDVLEQEVRDILPEAERIITKWAISPYAARNLTPGASQNAIKAGAVRALERLDTMQPVELEKPIRLEVDFTYSLYAQVAADIPGAEWPSGRTVAYTGGDMAEICHIFRLMINTGMGDEFI